MKNLNKILSVLSAAMVLSTFSVSAVYADEAVAEPIDEAPNELVNNNPVWIRPLIKGDVNIDGTLNVRDCAFIASKLAKGEELSDIADYNLDEKVNVRDAAALASSLSKKQID